MFEINVTQLKGLSMNPFFGKHIKFQLNSILWTHIRKRKFSNIYLNSLIMALPYFYILCSPLTWNFMKTVYVVKLIKQVDKQATPLHIHCRQWISRM